MATGPLMPPPVLPPAGRCAAAIAAGPGSILAPVWAVSVQKLNVPDLVVIDQYNQQQQQQQQQLQLQLQHQSGGRALGGSANVDQSHLLRTAQSINSTASNQPEAASLINAHQDLSTNSDHLHQQLQSQITFECLISYDKRKDKNLVVKWHHDDRVEAIYQWIPELNKRSIAPQYRAYIAPIVNTPQQQQHLQTPSLLAPEVGSNLTSSIQTLEAGFRLVRPSKELGGKYTCSAISSQNDDFKWKKMIVYTPPRAFRFNASRADIGAQLASQRERLIQLTQPALAGPASNFLATHQQQQLQQQQQQQLPLAYRMRGFEGHQPTTISPLMYSTIDYVNVNQQRARQSAAGTTYLDGFGPSRMQVGQVQGNLLARQVKPQQSNGVKLVCDIEQVFPVPEVSIYRLSKVDDPRPEKLAKLDTRIERDPLTGLYHVQVISILEDDELLMKYSPNEPVLFECLIALTNLELSKYADNKRSIVYRPSLQTRSSNGIQTSEDINLELIANSAANSLSSSRNHLLSSIIPLQPTLMFCLLSLAVLAHFRP